MAKTVTKKLMVWLSICISLTSMFAFLSFPAQAVDEEIMPLYNNVVSARCSASVSSSGVITITNNYMGIKAVTTKAIITTYIEKKVLGLFWSRVNIGTTDEQWCDTIYNYMYSGNHSFQLPSKGTYRVTAVFKIVGTGGADDEITCEVDTKY